ncbi:MAG: SpoIIIAH-like family protein, partial [Syntrophomonadaceae bacterium]
IINARRVAAAVLVITVIVTGVLIWGLNNQSSIDMPSPKRELRDTGKESIDTRIGEGVTTSASFFAEYRMERERSRSKQIELLREIINSQADTKAREAASLRLVDISRDMEEEMKIENLVKSRGYNECVVITQANNTMVIVQSEDIDIEEKNELIQLAGNATGNEVDKINVIIRK